jgi:hypothetical protein
MAVNTAITAALAPGTVPPDRQCVTNLQEIVDGVAAFTSVQVTPTGQQGGTGGSEAAQALNVANTALALAHSVQASIPQRRSLSQPTALPTGESTMPISWTPEMPDENYAVQITLYGPATATTNWSYCVVDESRTKTGCQLRFTNIPANFSVAWVVTDLSVL